MLTREDDGSFILYHRNKTIEREMDLSHDRWPNELRWSPKRTGCKYEIMAHHHESEDVAVIGKGPGLDKVTFDDLKSFGAVICCNDSVHRITSLCLKRPIYSVQLDENLRDTCACNHAHHFISSWAKDWVPNATILPTPWNKKLLTVVEAIALGKHIGAGKIVLFGFDAMNGDVSYAKCIGYTPGRNAKRFLEHQKYILEALGDIDFEFR